MIKAELAAECRHQRVCVSSSDETNSLASRLVRFIPVLFCQQAEFLPKAGMDAIE